MGRQATDPLANVEGAAEQIAYFQPLKKAYQAGRIPIEGAMAQVLSRITSGAYRN
jgi:hypothetical protein